MATRNSTTTNESPLTTDDAKALWQQYAYEVLAMIPRFIQTMGLPASSEHRGTHSALGHLPSTGQVRHALLADIGLQDRIHSAVERDFFAAIAKAKVGRDQVGGWLNRTTQRKTWKLATLRARQLYLEIQPYNPTAQSYEGIADFSPLADDRLADHEFRARFDRVIESLSLEDCQLLDAKVERSGYAVLAALRGKTEGALKAEACRLCSRIRHEVLGASDSHRAASTQAAE